MTVEWQKGYDKGFAEAKKQFARPHGEWIHTEDGECYCTLCKVRDWTNSDDYRFCPWCGADMRKESEVR